MDVLPNKAGIYKILNKINNKIYIGSAVNLIKRWAKHKRYAKGNYHHSITFQRAWDKYGEDAFEFIVLEIVEDTARLAEREQIWLDWLKPYDPEIGYNICRIGKSHVGLKRSDQARENMRNGQLGKERSVEHRFNISEAVRKYEKWPCPEGSKCKCKKCREKKAAYVREKRWEKEG